MPDPAFQPLAATLTRLEFLTWTNPGDLSCLSGMSLLKIMGIDLKPANFLATENVPAPLAGADFDVLAGLRSLAVLKLYVYDLDRCPLPVEIPEQCSCIELDVPFRGFHQQVLDRNWAPMGQVRSLTLQCDVMFSEDSTLYAGDLTSLQALEELHLRDFSEVIGLGMLEKLRSFSWKSTGSITLTLPAVPFQSLEVWSVQRLVLDFEPGAAQVVCQSLVSVSLGYRLCSGVGVPSLAGHSKASLQFVQVEGVEVVPRGFGGDEGEAMLTVLSTCARAVGRFVEFFRGNTAFMPSRHFECERVTSDAGSSVSSISRLYETYGIVPQYPRGDM